MHGRGGNGSARTRRVVRSYKTVADAGITEEIRGETGPGRTMAGYGTRTVSSFTGINGEGPETDANPDASADDSDMYGWQLGT